VGKLPVLSDIEIQRRLGTLKGWSRRGDAITKTFTFRGFPESAAFVGRLVEPAESMNHHPDVDVRYNKVTISLSTHDSGGITANDLALAERIEQL
jgi:4a-hydroxytetrahydrobiopterin dehydratase